MIDTMGAKLKNSHLLLFIGTRSGGVAFTGVSSGGVRFAGVMGEGVEFAGMEGEGVEFAGVKGGRVKLKLFHILCSSCFTISALSGLFLSSKSSIWVISVTRGAGAVGTSCCRGGK